jgi:molybdopterin-guanine dinucleotide biosynthesis protein A
MTSDRPQGSPRRGASDVAGLLLCGGRSQRMGVDKALLRIADEEATLIELAARALSAVAGEILLSTSQPDAYRFLGLRAVPDAFVGIGPLGGLIAGLEALADTPWVVVCGCDLPFASAPFLGSLLERARANPAAEVVMPTTPDGDEPLVAVYRPRVARILRSAAARGVHRLTAIPKDWDSARSREPFALEGAVIERVALGGLESDRLALLNVNDPTQLRQADRLARARRAANSQLSR